MMAGQQTVGGQAEQEQKAEWVLVFGDMVGDHTQVTITSTSEH